MKPDDSQTQANQSSPQADLSDYPDTTYQPSDASEQSSASVETESLSDEMNLTSQQNDTDADDPLSATEEVIHWTATGRSQKSRGALWYVVAILIAFGFIALDLLVFKSYTFSVLVIVMLAALIIYVRMPSQETEYTLSSHQGLYVGDKLYHLADFKAFGVVRNDDYNALMLIPVKRFALGVTVPFPENVGEQLVDLLGQRLPIEDMKPDLVDSLIRRLGL